MYGLNIRIGKLIPAALFTAATLLSFPLAVVPAGAEEIQSSIARGGLLYDKWYKVIKAPKPEQTHAAWPASNTKKSGDATQRCKACHGWDLMGKDGAYSSGSLPDIAWQPAHTVL